MFWLVEGQDSFKEFCNRGFTEAFVEIIPANHHQHPIENSIVAFYIRPLRETKGYILPIAHGECLNLHEDEVYLELKKLEKIYVRDKKEFLHYTILKPLYDVTLNLPPYIPPLTQAHNFIYRTYKDRLDTNAIVPITKHYEVCEQIYDDLEHRINQPVNKFYNDKATLVFNAIERNGICIDVDKFSKYFYETTENKVFTQYNFKTLTSRPSNKFAGVNYAALSHKDGSREAFIASNDVLVEYDISAYHPNLAANLVGYDFGGGDVHQRFAEMYGVDYKKAKELTFKQLYGGVFEQYKDLEFFQRVENFIKIVWDEFQTKGVVTCIGSEYRFERDKLEEMNPQKLFNYLLQNLETTTNVCILWEIMKILKGRNTKLVLYTYDSFLFDYDEKEEDVLVLIKEVFNKRRLRITEKNGINYTFE